MLSFQPGEADSDGQDRMFKAHHVSFFPRHALCLAIDSSQHNRPVDTFYIFAEYFAKCIFRFGEDGNNSQNDTIRIVHTSAQPGQLFDVTSIGY